ncbi:MAG: PBP1A family penicillin-binding protein [Bacteroidetes bacterium]|nr:PBP1A family penicillin-binding protein [Bacteroidota bacterium]
MNVRVTIFLLALLALALPLSAQDLPPIELKYASYALTDDGKVLDYYGAERRVELRSTGAVSPWVIRCLLATEDRDFYNHDGVSLKGLGRAVLETITGNTQGGSTLTMQLARNLFLSHERSISRKLREIDLARELEKKFGKDEILLLYLNTVYFGGGSYGIWAAAREYFDKDPAELSVTESATLVGLLKSPEGYNPLKHPEKARSRRNEVLHNLVEVGRISSAEYQKYRSQPLGLSPRDRIGSHFAEWVRREAGELLADKGVSLQQDQLRIYTTLDSRMQKAAEAAVDAQWKELPANMRDVQVGAVLTDVHTGAVRALIGGNPESSGRGLNHAVQIRRQPGSSFKPFLYASLLEQGYTLATPIMDSPIVVDSGLAWEWRPMNDSDSSSGTRVPMRYGIQRSLNLVAAHAMVELTDPVWVAAFAHRVGIESELREYPSLALGTSELSPLEMAEGYGTFASMGHRARPYFITRIENRNGRVLYRARPDTATALDSATAFLITDALQAVVDSGTATAVRRYYAGPAAGKTGTTQNSTDAWFAGYTPAHAMAVWVGYDDAARKLKGAYRYGGTVAAPIWGRTMAQIATVTFPDSSFTQPSTIEYLPLCRETGLLATDECPDTALYPVNTLLMPAECDEHGGGWLFGW